MNSDKEFIKTYLDSLSSEELHIVSYLIGCMRTRKDLYNKWCKEKNKVNKAIDKLHCWGEVLDHEFQQEMLKILEGDNDEKRED